MSTQAERAQLIERLADVLVALDAYAVSARHGGGLDSMSEYRAVLDALGSAAGVVGLSFIEISDARRARTPDERDG